MAKGHTDTSPGGVSRAASPATVMPAGARGASGQEPAEAPAET